MLYSKSRLPALLWTLAVLAATALPSLAVPGVTLSGYCYIGGKKVLLSPSVSYVAARLETPPASLAGVNVGAAYDAKHSSLLPMYGVAALALPAPGMAAADAMATTVSKAPGVSEVLPTYVMGKAEAIDIGQFVVRFTAAPSAARMDALQAAYHFTLLEDYNSWLSGAYLCQVQPGLGLTGVGVANAIHDKEPVVFSEPNLAHQLTFYANGASGAGRTTDRGITRAPRTPYIPNDPLFPRQWHLYNTGRDAAGRPTGAKVDADSKAADAWRLVKGDRGVTVAVLDQGCDIDHEEFAGKVIQGRDVYGNDSNVRPEGPDEAHSTSCAGLAVATQDNGVGVSGVAPGCSLMSLRIGTDVAFATDSQISSAFRYAASHGASVLSNSWGSNAGPDSLTSVLKSGITYAATYGRNGLGCLIFFASGNSGFYGYSVDDSPYATLPIVLSVGATTWFDTATWYSEGGNGLKICAPGGGGDVYPDLSTGLLMTTDVAHPMNWGYSPDGYNPGFDGTSAACPVAAGVGALLVSANPNLSRDEYYSILENSADKIDPAGSPYDASGHSYSYGYGRVNALAAVQSVLTGTKVTVAVATTNGPFYGGRVMDSSTPVIVSYVYRTKPRTVPIYDGYNKVLLVDAGSTVSFATIDSGGSSKLRWIMTPGQNPDTKVANAPLSLSYSYINQIRANISTTVLAGAAPLTDTNYVTATYQQAGQAGSMPVAATVKNVWIDAGTAVGMSAQSSGTTSGQRWVAPGLKPVSVVPTVSTLDVTPTYYQQVRPQVTLSGTTRNNQVSVTTHNLFGVAAYSQPEQASGTYTDWADVGTTLAFSDKSLGSPLLVATSPRSFTVAPALNGTVTYDVLPRADQSNVKATPAQLPADGTSQAVLTVTIKDSASQAIAGIAAARLSVQANVTDGLTITAPTEATDANGQARFTVVRNIDGPVVFTALLDGSALPSTASVTYLPVMTIPVPVPGLYLLTFPLTAPDSATQIANFGVNPKPTRLAGYNEDAQTYQAFDPAQPNTFFNIVPGKGWFLKTTSPGTIKLYGTWNISSGTLPSFSFDLPKPSFHMVGNPRPDAPLAFRMQDIRVSVDGVDKGDLRNKTNWNYVDPFVWAFNGRSYELVMDPSLQGAAGTRSQLEVFEGAFWRTKQAKVKLVITPGSVARAATPDPASAASYGFTVQAQAGNEISRVVLGVQSVALRAVRPPAAAEGAGLTLDVVSADGSRAAADYLAGAVPGETTWKLHVSGSGGRAVTLSWPSLLRGLPEGYQAHLVQPGSGRGVLLNTAGSLTVNGDGDLTVTVSPRGAGQLNVLGFQPVPGRGRSVDFQVQLNGTASVVVQVCGMTGKIVTQTAPVTAAGTARVSWDGTDGQGRPLPAGVYQVVLIARTDAGDTVRAVRTVRVQ